MIPVKVISVEKNTGLSLIEWKNLEGNTLRSVVPTDSITKDTGGYTHENPLMGVPYGVRWESVPIAFLSVSALANELRNNGIFTAGDLAEKLSTAKAIILNLAGVTVNKLVQHAQQTSAEEQ